MRYFRSALICFIALVLLSSVAAAQDANAAPAGSAAQAGAPVSLDQLVAKVIDREHFAMTQLRSLHPIVETYIQNLKDTARAPIFRLATNIFSGNST